MSTANTVTFIEQLSDGNRFQTLDAEAFVKRLERCTPTYELTNKEKNKLYFDVDYKLPEETPFDIEYTKKLEEFTSDMVIFHAKEALPEGSPKPRIAIAVSHGYSNEKQCYKYSVRAFVTNYTCSRNYNKSIAKYLNDCISNDSLSRDARKLMKDIFEVGVLDVNEEFFDTSVYSHNRKMRCIGTSKMGEDRPLILVTGTIQSTVLTAFFDEDCIDITPEGYDDEPNTTNPGQAVAYPPASKHICEKYHAYASIISLSVLDNYATWYEFTKASANIGVPFDVYHQIVSQTPGYSFEMNENNRAVFHEQNDPKRGSVGWKRIYDMANKSDPEKKKLLDIKFRKNSTEKLIDEDFTSCDWAEFFVVKYGDKFVVKDRKVYQFNGVYWVKDNEKYDCLGKFVAQKYFEDLYDFAQKEKKRLEAKKETAITEKADEKLIEKFEKLIEKADYFIDHKLKNIRNSAQRKAVISDIVMLLKSDIEFDTNPFLFAFNNKVLNLKDGCLVDPPRADDYITTTCGWDFDDTYEFDKKMGELMAIINTIFLDKAVMDAYLQYLSTGLYGEQVEKLGIATGGGSNGKSLLSSLIMIVLGDYGYKLASSLLLSEIKEGANPAVANLSNKRFLLVQEPDPTKRMNASTVKELTGDKTLNARQCYSNDTKTRLRNTTLMEANELPLLNDMTRGGVGFSILRRFDVYSFDATAVTQQEFDKMEEAERTNVIIANPYYKTDKFQHEYKQAFFCILSQHFGKFVKNDMKLSPLPPACLKASDAYFKMCDGFNQWFNDHYESCEDQYIFISDLYVHYKSDHIFKLLSKSDQKNCTKKNFAEDLKKNMFIKKTFRERNASFAGKQLSKPFIAGFKLIDTFDASEEVSKLAAIIDRNTKLSSDEKKKFKEGLDNLAERQPMTLRKMTETQKVFAHFNYGKYNELVNMLENEFEVDIFPSSF